MADRWRMDRLRVMNRVRMSLQRSDFHTWSCFWSYLTWSYLAWSDLVLFGLVLFDLVLFEGWGEEVYLDFDSTLGSWVESLDQLD